MKTFDQTSNDFQDSSSLTSDIELMRSTLNQQGYLYLRNVAPREVVEEVRKDVLEVCRSAGWLDTDSALLEGKWSGMGPFTENEPDYMKVYRHVLRLPSFHNLPENTHLIGLMKKIINGQVTVHRRRIGRITFPQNVEQTTGTHQDWHYIRGNPETYTMWMPLGDCPVELGGLAILSGSHRHGFIEHTEFEGKKYAAAGIADKNLPPDNDLEWHSGDMKMGDALIFHSHTIHKALPNLTKDKLRLSCDNRYQLAGTAITADSMTSHYNLD
jgi:ectoine hydroxylase-related dioxygenase (phytanoyl-CoA dioxygenase family)